MKYFTKIICLLTLPVFFLTGCGDEMAFQLGDNHFRWESKNFDVDKHEWRGESFNASSGLYKFDFKLNDANEDHELYFEDFYSMNADYTGSYTFVNGSADHGEFDWFELEINKSGNTSDTPFESSSSSWVSGSVTISIEEGYLIIEFSMTYDDARVVSGYYAEPV